MTAHGEESGLWARAVAGDARAFASVFESHYDRVFRHVVGQADQRADADEICGAAFLELWRLRARVRVVDGSVLPWLLLTAGNLARNQSRGLRRHRDLLRRLPRDAEVGDAAAMVEEQDELDRRAAAVGRALRRLRPIEAQLFDLTGSGGLSIQEAAELLGLSAGAARVRLHRARTQLRGDLVADLGSPFSEEVR